MRLWQKIAIGTVCIVIVIVASWYVWFRPIPGPSHGGTLVVAVLLDPDGLDPWRTAAACSYYITWNIYSTLVRANADTWEIEPALAKSWEVSENSTVYTFHLRTGVKFHNGREMTADDVKWCFDKIRDPNFGHVKWKDYNVTIDRVEVVDNYTARFYLKSPMGNLFLANLAMQYAAIEPREEVEKYGNLKIHPIGTGPYKFVEWIEGDHVKLVKFDDYWEPGLPSLDEIIIKPVGEEAARIAGLKTGDYDVIQALDPPDANDINATKGLKVVELPGTIIFATIINNKRPPYDDVRVRQAMAYAINKDEIIEIQFLSYAKKVGCWMNPTYSVYNLDTEMYFPYDPEEAKKLLTEAGYPNGFEFTYTLPSNYEYHIKTATIIQSQLAKVGIKANFEMVDWSTWLSRVYSGRDFQVTQIGHTGRIDPYQLLDRFGSQAPTNYMNYNNSRVDALLEKDLKQILKLEERISLYHEILSTMTTEVASLPICIPSNLFGMKEDVQGWKGFPIDIFDLRTVYRTSTAKSAYQSFSLQLILNFALLAPPCDVVSIDVETRGKTDEH
jgi:peptide/nickel transport system substrate-binding protein